MVRLSLGNTRFNTLEVYMKEANNLQLLDVISALNTHIFQLIEPIGSMDLQNDSTLMDAYIFNVNFCKNLNNITVSCFHSRSATRSTNVYLLPSPLSISFCDPISHIER
jgi:hypothetical protein